MQASYDVYIERKIIIKMKFQQVKYDSIEYYRLIVIFNKYYNKWFINMDSRKNLCGKYSKKFKIIEGLMDKDGE